MTLPLPDLHSESESFAEAPLIDHLRELKKRVMWSVLALLGAFIVCTIFAEDLYQFLAQPLIDALPDEEGRRLIYTGLTEAFMTYLKLSFYSAVVITFPFWAVQIYLFIAPGLYKKERQVLLPFLIVTPILFFAGAALAYYWVFPMAWAFFLGFESLGMGSGALPIQLEARVSEYLSLVLQIIFAFGVTFQLPVLLNLLARVGIVTAESLKQKRRFAIIGLLVVAAILTPPDVISQIGLAIPLLLLYELSIISCRIVEKKHQNDQNHQGEIKHDA